jgi:Family of unknown function (DUF6348)
MINRDWGGDQRMTSIMDLTALAMEKRGYSVTRHDTCLEHRDSGFIIKPVFFDSPPSTTLIRSNTAITISHPDLIPDGVFEYQHTFGATLDDAIREGIDQWLQVDFVVFLDALRDTPEQCQAFDITFPQPDGAGLNRRALLGPVGHMAIEAISDEEHPFCACCFLTKNFEAFRPLLEADAFYGIRLFAAHNDRGASQADCRVNGQDWEVGKRALVSYADTWPQAGLEWRKQYVILQTRSHGPA